jgi:NTE family protein
MHSGWSRQKFISIAVLTVAVILGSSSGRANESADRVLILGGGGPVGEAWESGIIAGLKEKESRWCVPSGLSELRLDRSSARLAGKMSDGDFINAALEPTDDGPKPPASQKPPDLSFLATKLAEMNTGQRPRQDIRAEIGAWAMRVRPVVTETKFVSSYQRRFPQSKWPDPRYEAITWTSTMV